MSREHQLEIPFGDGAKRNGEILQLLSPDQLFDRAERFIPLLGEDRRVERKGAAVQAPAIGDNLAMWANTSPEGGILVVGIDKHGNLEGCSQLETRRLNSLEKAGKVYSPDARYEVKRVPVLRANGAKDFVLVFRVFYHETRVVETSSGKVFVRWGDEKKELKTDQERRQLRIDKGEIQHEQEPCQFKYPDEFDAALIRQWASTVREYKGLSGDPSDTKILELLHLGKRQHGTFVPNLACALMFAKDPLPLCPGCKIRFLRFDGTKERTGDKWNAVKDEWVEGAIPHQISQASQLIASQIRKFSILARDGKFNTTLEYPDEAWYEALVNACVHRSYNMKNMNIFVKMFDDRLEIDSPGPFPPGVSPDNIYDVQHARNPFLMAALYYLDLVKAANEGVRRMRETMLALNLPEPEFSQREFGGRAGVRVTLRNNIRSRKVWVDSDVRDLVGDAIASSLTENEKLVLNFLVVHDRINVSDAQRITGRYWKAAKDILTSLTNKSILEYNRRLAKSEKDTQAYWTLKHP